MCLFLFIIVYMYIGIIYFLNHFESNPQTPVWCGQIQPENWLAFFYKPPRAASKSDIAVPLICSKPNEDSFLPQIINYKLLCRAFRVFHTLLSTPVSPSLLPPLPDLSSAPPILNCFWLPVSSVIFLGISCSRYIHLFISLSHSSMAQLKFLLWLPWPLPTLPNTDST